MKILEGAGNNQNVRQTQTIALARSSGRSLRGPFAKWNRRPRLGNRSPRQQYQWVRWWQIHLPIFIKTHVDFIESMPKVIQDILCSIQNCMRGPPLPSSDALVHQSSFAIVHPPPDESSQNTAATRRMSQYGHSGNVRPWRKMDFCQPRIRVPPR